MSKVRSIVRRSLLKAKGHPRFDPMANRMFEIWYDMPFPPAHYYSPPGSRYFSNWMLMMFYLSIPATSARKTVMLIFFFKRYCRGCAKAL